MVKIPREQYNKDREQVWREMKLHPSRNVKDIAEEFGFSVQKVYKILREKSEPFKKSSMSNSKQVSRHFLILIKTSGNPSLSFLKINDHERFLDEKVINEIGLNLDFCYEANGNPDIVLGVSSNDIKQIKILCNMIENGFETKFDKIEIIEILRPFGFHHKSHSLALIS